MGDDVKSRKLFVSSEYLENAQQWYISGYHICNLATLRMVAKTLVAALAPIHDEAEDPGDSSANRERHEPQRRMDRHQDHGQRGDGQERHERPHVVATAVAHAPAAKMAASFRFEPAAKDAAYWTPPA